MRRKQPFVAQVERRISNLRETASLDTQFFRNKWIVRLDSLFSIASSIAKGEVRRQQVGDSLQYITPKERQMWAHVAAHIAEVMGNLSKGYDERQFNEDLTELERQVDEIKELQAQSDRAASRAMETESENSGAVSNS